MSCVLIYSLRCEHSKALIEFVKTHEQLGKIVKLHDVNTMGVPKGIDRVPSLITADGNILIGGDVKTHLQDFISEDITPVSGSTKSFDLNGVDMSGNWFTLDSFGQSLKPNITKELEEKINTKVEDAYHKLKN